MWYEDIFDVRQIYFCFICIFECDIQKLLESDVKLVRRQSGGGTVYHDLGNLNFSFIRPTRDHHKEINNQILIKALEKNNIMAYSSGRSDILVNHNGPKKISGAAFKQKKDRSFQLVHE